MREKRQKKEVIQITYYLILLLFFFVSSTGRAAFSSVLISDKPISLHFQDAPIGAILQALADHQALNLVIADSVSGHHSLYLDNVPWQQALAIILRIGKLAVESHGNIMLILPQQQLNEQQQLEEQAKQASLTLKPLATLMYQVRHATASELAKFLKSSETPLSARGKVIVDDRLNVLIIQDVVDVFNNSKAILNHLDQAVSQVRLAAHIVTMTDESLRELGIQWGFVTKHNQSNAHNGHLMPFEPRVNGGIQFAKLNGRLLDLELSALELENQIEIIASPRLLTADRETASIKQGTEIPYEMSNGANGSTSIAFKDAVLGLEVTPQIRAGNRIELKLYITQNTPGRAMKRSNGGEILAIDTQKIKTQVIVNNGETLVLGGVFQRSGAINTKSVPLLGRLPLIGYFFRNKVKQKTKKELVIFITPTIVAA